MTIADALRRPPRPEQPTTATTDSRILIVDIERLPGLTPIFDQRTSGFIPVSKWRRLPSLLCFAAKWYGKRTVEFHAAWDDPIAMLERAWQLYDEADIVVGYNQIRFDNRHLKSDWLVAGMAPPRPWRNVDLFAVNKQLFGFESKSLDHLCRRLGLDTKSGHYDADDAELCIEGDIRAQRRMKRYNRGDVRITEQAYDALRPWLASHPTIAVSNSDKPACNPCGSYNLLPDGEYRTPTFVYPLFRCQDCGSLMRDRHGVRITDSHGVRDV